jgi:hypothetical protein
MAALAHQLARLIGPFHVAVSALSRMTSTQRATSVMSPLARTAA